MHKTYSFILNITSLVVFFNLKVTSTTLDSLGTETVSGQIYIIHQVDKETLFAIARRYGVRVADIQLLNPETKNGLKLGQKLRIPYTAYDWSRYMYHKIDQGQTLYSLAKKYNTTIENIKAWNQLNDNELIQGKWIIVQEQKKVDNLPQINVNTYNENIRKSSNKAENIKDTDSREFNNPKSESNNLISNTTRVGKYTTYQNENFYLGLHTHAEVGSIVRVTNPEKNIKIYVRIVGRPTEAQKNNDPSIGIWLSTKALETLQINGSSTMVNLEFLPEN